jgi:hypothetical protein
MKAEMLRRTITSRSFIMTDEQRVLGEEKVNPSEKRERPKPENENLGRDKVTRGRRF